LHHKSTILFLFLALWVALCAGCQAPQASSVPVTPETEALTAAVVAEWHFAHARSALGWKPTHDLTRFTLDGEGLHTRSTGGDPYMVGPAIKLDPAVALHLEIRMRSSKGADGQLFWEGAGQSFNEAASQHFTITADGQWHTYRLDLKGHPAWQGPITRLRLDPSTQADAEISIAYIRVLGTLPAGLTVGRFGPTLGIARAGEPFIVQATVANTGDLPAQDIPLRLEAPVALSTVSTVAEARIALLESSRPITVSWTLQGPAGVYPIRLWQGAHLLAQNTVVVEDLAPAARLTVGEQPLRLIFTRQPFGYGVGTLEWHDGQKWRVAGCLRSLGRIAYRDRQGQDHEAFLYADEGTAGRHAVSFVARHTDEDGTLWTMRAVFQAVPGSPWLRLKYELSADHPVQLLSWAGPEYLAGEGSFGAERESGLFPGLEFLMGAEESSGADFVDPPLNRRYVPHPHKVTIPLMAVTQAGMTTGVMWDPLQAWDGQHDRPAALYASPNTWEGQANHLMRLFVPGATAGLPENRDRLEQPYELPAGKALRLTADLFAGPARDPLAPLEVWLASRPQPVLPELPSLGRTPQEALRLCLDNYTTVTWVASARGWRYALHDPWGPGSDTAIALHLWVSSLGGKVAEKTARGWREMVRASLASPPVGGQPNQWFYRPALLLHTAQPAMAMRQFVEEALAMAGRQRPDGSWGFVPVAGGPARGFGLAGDTSNGYSATFAFPILYVARISGHLRLVEAGLKALAYLERQPLRPEGAQTWELSLHVPDLLASAWVSQAFLEGYRLTGEVRYLELAQRWALAGLPFVYLWNPPDRPVMRYTTIPVFGASNYVFPWFGRPVMWNGLDYAIGLQGLAAELEDAGVPPLLDWRHLAEGITLAAAQMQPATGPYRGMYPDAWDVVAGGEAYTWWLTPSYLAHNLLLLQGEEGVQVHTRILSLDGQRLHISAAMPILATEVEDGAVTVRVRYHRGETAAILFAPLQKAPAQVRVNGQPVPATSPWESFAEGLLVVKIPFTDGDMGTVTVVP